jgi:transcription initiation factor TFIIIB Brf1 subunit/transcription initiation factor TFIIB
VQVLKIEIKNRTETKYKEEFALKVNKNPHEFLPEDHKLVEDYLIEKMAIYLAKMSMHDLYLSSRRPSLLAVGSIYVALKICEQLKKKELINTYVVTSLIQTSRM